jgi:hypothetical protein
MGQKVGRFFVEVGKVAAKAATSAVGAMVPVVGTPIANYLNSKYAVGTGDLKAGVPVGVNVPEDAKVKAINTPAQLQALVKEYPKEAAKAGLTVDMIKNEVQQAKEQVKAIGGLISFGKANKVKDQVNPGPFPNLGKAVKGELPKFAKGGEPKPKKARTPAQLEATRKLVEANRKRRAQQKK